MQKHNLGSLNLKRHYRKQVKRYSAKVPGVRIQIDVCKIAINLYQYTAIDDCTRYKILALYKRRTAINTVSFLEKVLERMPFPIQRIQTDRGQEFFAYIVQDYLKEHKIKFRPIKPLSPHLNGKVERSQKTDLDEFYSSVDIRSIELPKQLNNWEHYYNHNRGHTSLSGKSPWEKYQELESSVPSIQEVEQNYDPLKEPLIMQNYKYNKELRSIIKHKKALSIIN